jgi:hypothetical protein
MKAPRIKKTKQSMSAVEALDLDPAAWPKFEALVKSAAKMGPKPHTQSKGPIRTKSAASFGVKTIRVDRLITSDAQLPTAQPAHAKRVEE